MNPSDFREHLQRALGTGYILERELEGGGMSRVFVAHDVQLGRRIVVKVLHPDQAAGLSTARFAREVTLAAQLQHPHLVPVLSAGEVDGLPYYTMPFVEGESLRARLARVGALPVAEAMRLTRELADALAYSHGRGVIHRDLKPENVLLSGGHAVVADFGIAKALVVATQDRGSGAAIAATDSATTTGTGRGLVIGTPAYMAPEQAAGDPAIDQRADLYSLGVVAYELLAGTPPFAGRSAQALLAAHMTEPPMHVSERRADAPPELSAVVMRLLAKRPEDRPRNAAEVLHDLDAIATPSAGPSRGSGKRLRPFGSRRSVVAGAVLLIVLGIGAVVARGRWVPATSDARARETSAVPSTPQSVAVLPLDNAGSDTSDAYFAAGMTDEVTTAIMRVPGLRVISRSAASLVDARQPVDRREAGRRLHADAVLTGRVRHQGTTKLRLFVELIDVASGTLLWGDTYERDVKDAFHVQDEVAKAIAAALRVRLAGTAQLARQGTENAEAHDLVMRARHLSTVYTEESLRRAIDLFGRARDLDPNYAAAWTGLGETWGRLADDFIPAKQALPEMRKAVARALALDSTLADVHALRAGLAGYYDRDYALADREYVRAFALDSMLSGPAADYANLLSAQGHPDSAAAMLRQAVRLDQFSPYLAFWAPLNFIYAGQLADAHKACDVAGDVSPALGHRCRVQLLFAEERYAALVDTLRSAAEPTPWTHAHLAAALARLGRLPDARREAELVEAAARTRYIDERIPAEMYAVMGDADRALKWLDAGVVSNAAILAYMNVDTQLAPLRKDPRFREMLRRVGLR